jgi:branched-chain amino acid transport system substrate-binding protein
MKQTIKITGGILMVIIAVLALVYRADFSPKNSVIKIGIITPLSGEYGALGENLRKGAELAKEQYLKDHPGVRVEIVAEDDALNAVKGLSAYKKMASIDQIDGLISASAPTLGAVYPELLKTGLPTVTVSSQSSDEQDDSVFQVSPATEPVSEALGAYVKEMKTSRPVLVYTNDSLTEKLKRRLIKGFGADMPTFAVNRDGADVRTIVSKVLAEKPTLIIMSNYEPVGAQVTREIIRQSGKVKVQFAFDPLFNSGLSEYKKIFGDVSKLDGSIVVSMKASVDAKSPETARFASEYKEKYSVEPGNFSDIGYDAFMVLVNAHAGTSQDWVKNIKQTQYSGVTGKISFDALGTRLPEFTITTLKNGAIPGDYISGK